jgi:hypothetical protein
LKEILLRILPRSSSSSCCPLFGILSRLCLLIIGSICTLGFETTAVVRLSFPPGSRSPPDICSVDELFTKTKKRFQNKFKKKPYI